MTQSEYVSVFKEDLVDAVKLCHAGLAQDSPKMPKEYLNELLNLCLATCLYQAERRLLRT